MGRGKYEPTTLEIARDELFSHIQRCGVLDADEDHRSEWMGETIQYLRERFPALTQAEAAELEEIGRRYCMPAIPHGEVAAGDVWTDSEDGPDPDEAAATDNDAATDTSAVDAMAEELPAPAGASTDSTDEVTAA